MINRWIGDIALLLQAKIGVTSALIAWAGVVSYRLADGVDFSVRVRLRLVIAAVGRGFRGPVNGERVLGDRIDWRRFLRGVTPPRQTPCDACTRRTGTGVDASFLIRKFLALPCRPVARLAGDAW